MRRTIAKIQVKNYQSLYDLSLDLGKFTVVFGDSDVGKTSEVVSSREQ